MPVNVFRRGLMVLLTVGSVVLLSAREAHAQREFSLECCEDYSVCGGTDLPDACDELVFMYSEILSSFSNWSPGWYFRDSSAWPQDWQETDEVSGGLDRNYMDALGYADLSAYAGHGTGAASEPNGSWDLAMGFDHSGVCDVTSPRQMKMGEQGSDGWDGDGDNEYVFMDASCSMVIGELDQVWENWGPGILMRSHQGLGMHGSPTDADDRGEEFIENVDHGDSNRSAWLEAGESCFLWWCWNSPAVITFGEDSSDAWDRHRNETMRSPRTDAPSGWGGYYYWSWIDNGGC